MATKKTPIEKPLTPRQEAALAVYASLIGGLANQVLNAENGEVFRALRKESVHAADVFFQGVGEQS